MPKFDKSTQFGGATDGAPTAAGSLTPSAGGDVTIAYGVNSNTGVNVFPAPWTNLIINPSAFGKMGWQRTLGTAPVSLSYAVPGTQAWAIKMAAFGSTANPIFTGKGNGNNSLPFTAASQSYIAGKVLLAVLEFESNGANQVLCNMTDSIGNAWVHLADAVGVRLGPLGQLAQVSMFYVENSIGGTGTVSFTGGGAGTPAPFWQIYEVDNLAPVPSPGSALRLLSSLGCGV